MKTRITGLWVPLVTPFLQGDLDRTSLINLVKSLEDKVDGFVPCLSSGEGSKMPKELWKEVVQTVKDNTTKPIIAGILNPSPETINELTNDAKDIGCIGVAVPQQGESVESRKEFCRAISQASALPIVIYNTEKTHFDNAADIIELSHYENIIAIKDSSQNHAFFNDMLAAKRDGKLDLSILQGMENQLLQSTGCDGYLISLANTEPELCKEMLLNSSNETNSKIMEKWEELGLATETWYVGIKTALVKRGIIKSAELIK